MARFVDIKFDLDEFIPKEVTDAKTRKAMVKAGQKVLFSKLKVAALRHKVTGEMAESLDIAIPRENKVGDTIGYIDFVGGVDEIQVSGKFKSRISKKDGRILLTHKRFHKTNYIKAMLIEYGSSHQRAQPFIRPTVAANESEVIEAMKKAFEKASGVKAE